MDEPLRSGGERSGADCEGTLRRGRASPPAHRMVGADLHEWVLECGITIKAAAVGTRRRTVSVFEFTARFHAVGSPLDTDSVHHFPHDRLVVAELWSGIIIAIRIATVRLFCRTTPHEFIAGKFHLARICPGTLGREKGCDLAIWLDTTLSLIAPSINALTVAVRTAEAESGPAVLDTLSRKTIAGVSGAFAIRDALGCRCIVVLITVCVRSIAVRESVATVEFAIASYRISPGIQWISMALLVTTTEQEKGERTKDD